jgi:hypothetical protein
MRKWILCDYDCSGFHEIQARDEHPERDSFDDEMALAIARKQAAAGKRAARRAVKIHDRDAPEVAKVREQIYGGRTLPELVSHHLAKARNV